MTASRPRMRAPDVRRLELLEQIERGGTISAAADALHFSCSGLSQQLRQMEADFGVLLVERTARAATLTDAGRLLLLHSTAVRERLEQAELEIREIAELRGGRLRLATFRSVGQTLVAEAVAYFRSHWPDVDLTLREGEPESYLGLLRSDELDIALTFDYDGVDPTLDERLASVLLCEEEMLVVLPARHPLAGSPEVQLRALSREVWIGSTATSSVATFTSVACRRGGFEPDVRLRTDDYRVAGALVAGGAGISFLPRRVAATLPPGCVARPLAGERLLRRIHAAHRLGSERAPAIARMLQVLRELGDDDG